MLLYRIPNDFIVEPRQLNVLCLANSDDRVRVMKAHYNSVILYPLFLLHPKAACGDSLKYPFGTYFSAYQNRPTGVPFGEPSERESPAQQGTSVRNGMPFVYEKSKI